MTFMLLSAKVIHVFTLNSLTFLAFPSLIYWEEEKDKGWKRIDVFEFPSNNNVLRFMMHQLQVQIWGYAPVETIFFGIKGKHCVDLKWTYTKMVNSIITFLLDSHLFMSILICSYKVGLYTTIFPNKFPNFVTYVQLILIKGDWRITSSIRMYVSMVVL